MADVAEPRANPPQSQAEAAVRILRHEVGDLLQTVYATAALLQQRLPAGWELERRILTEMRARGEACRALLDQTHDLICPMSLMREPIHWGDVLGPLIAAAAKRHPALGIEPTWQTVPAVFADAQRLDQVGRLILADVCESAASQVGMVLSSSSDAREVKWSVCRDGDAVPADHLERYFRLGTMDVQGPCSIGMVLAGRIVQLHGGRILAENRREGGLRITVYLPASTEERN
jgi:K+-sensing histidine kinase KdpD